jgi:hypothetical protein
MKRNRNYICKNDPFYHLDKLAYLKSTWATPLYMYQGYLSSQLNGNFSKRATFGIGYDSLASWIEWKYVSVIINCYINRNTLLIFYFNQ